MKKLYYSIGEVSEITSIEQHVLRYWETVFDELKPRKNKAGNRIYKEEDLTVILKLKELIQKQKYSTAGAKKVLEEGRSAEDSQNKIQPEVKRDLQEIRIFLQQLSDQL
ncbi:MAG: MerR family transcriptional regulator [Balneolaceae bacterium]